jgi:hypothetical protein
VHPRALEAIDDAKLSEHVLEIRDLREHEVPFFEDMLYAALA